MGRVIEDDRQRSIPAHAGEPFAPIRDSTAAAVYPRPRGGTVCESRSTVTIIGLSPPTRGNLAKAFAIGRSQGYIPAHAGEPA